MREEGKVRYLGEAGTCGNHDFSNSAVAPYRFSESYQPACGSRVSSTFIRRQGGYEPKEGSHDGFGKDLA